jgi:ferredoxin
MVSLLDSPEATKMAPLFPKNHGQYQQKIFMIFYEKGIAFSKIHATMNVRFLTYTKKQDKIGGITMAFVITDACVACGSCADQCPVEAISEGDGQFVIDADTCISCGACAGTCPVEAIVED